MPGARPMYWCDLTCKRASVGQSEGLLIPRSSVRVCLNPEDSRSNRFELHRPSIKGTKLLLKIMKTIIIITHWAVLYKPPLNAAEKLAPFEKVCSCGKEEARTAQGWSTLKREDQSSSWIQYCLNQSCLKNTMRCVHWQCSHSFAHKSSSHTPTTQATAPGLSVSNGVMISSSWWTQQCDKETTLSLFVCFNGL